METGSKWISSTIARSSLVNKSTSGRRRPGTWWRAVTGCSLFVNVGIYLLTAHTLSPQELGAYLFVQWSANIIVPACGAGISTLASRRIVELQSREAPRIIAGSFYFLWYRQHRSILFYIFCYAGYAYICTALLPICTFTVLSLAGLATLPLLLSAVAGATLCSLQKSELLALLNLFGTLLTFLLFTIAAQVKVIPVEALLLASALANTLTLLLAVLCVMRLLPLGKALPPGIFLRERLVSSLKRSWLLFLADSLLWERGELLLLAYCCSPAETGFYALSTLGSTAISALTPYLFTYWLHPLLLYLFPRHRYLNSYDAFIKTTCYIIFLSVPICLALNFFCPAMIKFCLGSAYMPMVQPLRILLSSTILSSLTTVSLTHLAHHQHIGQQRWPYLGIAALKLLLAVPLILLWGITGAAIATAMTQAIASCLSFYFCRVALRANERGITRN